MRRKKEVPDCRTCGACCSPWQQQDAFCDLEPRDVTRLGAYAKKHAVTETTLQSIARAVATGRHIPDAVLRTKDEEQRSGPLKGLHVVTCVALRGSVMGRCSCAVYEKRPRACREAVKPGDRTCRDIRRMVASVIEEVQEETKK